MFDHYSNSLSLFFSLRSIFFIFFSCTKKTFIPSYPMRVKKTNIADIRPNICRLKVKELNNNFLRCVMKIENSENTFFVCRKNQELLSRKEIIQCLYFIVNLTYMATLISISFISISLHLDCNMEEFSCRLNYIIPASSTIMGIISLFCSPNMVMIADMIFFPITLVFTSALAKGKLLTFSHDISTSIQLLSKKLAVLLIYENDSSFFENFLLIFAINFFVDLLLYYIPYKYCPDIYNTIKKPPLRIHNTYTSLVKHKNSFFENDSQEIAGNFFFILKEVMLIAPFLIFLFYRLN